MTIKLGERLYQTVPALYRNRDNGDLKRYFDATGDLLDRLQATLQQRYYDNFPDTPLDGSPACQDWLIPYFAQLLDVRLVSPTARGRRAEVANAVRWRQAKGTLWVIEEIAQAVAGLEMVVHEGWRRVAVTPRLNTPRVPSTVYGYRKDAPRAWPGLAARHPGLPAVTVDFRCPSGAVAVKQENPGTQYSTIDGVNHRWRQASRHGAPCWPDSYEDVSRRTVDFRDHDWRRGHFHPRKLLLYSAPPAGFFPPAIKGVAWSEPHSAAFLEHIEVIEQDQLTIYRNKSLASTVFVPVAISGVIKLGQVASGVGDAAAHTWRFEGLVLRNTVELDSGRIELLRCAARKIEVHSVDKNQPVIKARGCLFKQLQAARGLVQLEYCTVLDRTLSETIQASDCLFMGSIRKDQRPPTPPDRGCIRYSRIPPASDDGGLVIEHSTRVEPEFFEHRFGQRGCGVLRPATAPAIRHGAEDGGEMGAYHDQHLSLLAEAAVDKLQDFLPVGVQAVVIPDPRLPRMPGAIQ